MNNLLNSIGELSLVKKIIGLVAIIAVVIALIATAIFGNKVDTSYKVNLSDGKDVLVTGDVTITKQDYFEHLLEDNGANAVINDALEQIADIELKDQKDDVKKAIEDKVKSYEAYASDGLESYAKSLGYSSKKEWVSQAIEPDAKIDLLNKKYIKDNISSLLTDYQLCSFKKITVDKESTALNIIKEATSEDKFDELMKKEDYTSEDSGIVTKNSTLDDNLKKKLSDLSKVNKNGVYPNAIKLSDDKYAVVYLYNTDKKDTESYITSLSSDNKLIEEVQGKYLKKYGFKVYSKRLSSEIKALSKDYLE